MNATFVILVAEDEESDFDLLDLALKRTTHACRVEWVRNGADARRYITGEEEFRDRQRHPFPDLLITDLKMPNVTGLQLLEWLKDGTQYRRLPVVVMTSSNQPTDIDRAYALGANAYLLKPTRFEDLIELCGHIVAFWSRAIRYRSSTHSPSGGIPHVS
jgi:CheY-like chemotaxis protein